MNKQPNVVAVSRSATHSFSKTSVPVIHLVEGQGVADDAHAGVTVKHRSRVRRDPSQPNLRQVHLLHSELFATLNSAGFTISAGVMGENITTADLDLLAMPTGTLLHVGDTAIVRITGLRNPCAQLDNHQPGLTAAVLDRDDAGNVIRKAGVMAVVLASGAVRPGDLIKAVSPPLPHTRLDVV